MLPRDILFSQLPKLLVQATSKRLLARTSQKPRPEKKHYRLWALPGDLVYVKDILAKQYTVRWHPGLNAGIDDDRTIYALCDGIMIMTEEKYEPDWENSQVNEIYKNELAPPYVRYVHVIPKRRISEFKLVDEV